MALEEQVMEQLKTAMKAKDEAALRALRAIKAAIIVAKTSEGAGGVLKEEDEPKLLQKMVKQRKDSIAIFEQQGRTDLAAKEYEEVAVIEKFLPEQITGDKLKEIIQGVIAEVNATSPADMGKVMGAATKKLNGQADGKEVSAIVKALLAQ
jgi:uncharacterized protein